MTTSMTITEAMRQLGSVGEMRDLARLGGRPSPPPLNAHVHLPPNFSAFQTAGQAVSLAAGEGLALLGASNYYHYGLYGDFAADCLRQGIFPLVGLEILSQVSALRKASVKINDPGNPGRMYLCGKSAGGLCEPSPAAAGALATIRRNDGLRMRQMTQRLVEHFAQLGVSVELTVEAVVDKVAARCRCPRDWVFLQERHLAQAFQEALFDLGDAAGAAGDLLAGGDAAASQGLLRSRLMKAGGPAFIPEQFLDFADARRLVLDLGGVPCYPVLADGADPVCPYEQPVDALIQRLGEAGIFCVEFIPNRNRPEVLRQYARAMRQAGLVVTAGTEHNTPAMLPMTPRSRSGAIDEDIQAIFWEGGCVLAAHQFLRAWGEVGYVDDAGRPAGSYSDQEARISDMSALGAAVIARAAGAAAE